MLRQLALETSGTGGSVAALVGDNVLAQLHLDPQQRSAKALAPAIQEVLRQVGWMPRDMQLVAVTIGPGSFTGLRIGVTTAKVVAYAVHAEVLGVNTLEVIAEQMPPEVCRLSAVIDAQRQELFVNNFERDEAGRLKLAGETAIMSCESWLASLSPAMHVAGPGLKKLAARLPQHIVALPPDLGEPTAAGVGRLAWRYYGAGRRDDLWQLVPLYLRRSAAEEKWDRAGPTVAPLD